MYEPGDLAHGHEAARRAHGASYRLWAAILGSIAALALVSTLLWHPQPLLVWNASSSSPPGLYAIGGAGHVMVGDLVVAWAPPAARGLAARRNYLPTSAPLIKRVAAVQGDCVCASGALVLINGREASLRLASDRQGRPLPWWRGCKSLRRGELFLLSPRAPLAFDGRYFGLTHGRELIGKAWLLWPR